MRVRRICRLLLSGERAAERVLADAVDAARVVAGVALDAAPAAVARFRKDVPCDAPATLEEIGSACRLIITMLPDGHAVRRVLLGTSGVVAGLTASARPAREGAAGGI